MAMNRSRVMMVPGNGTWKMVCLRQKSLTLGRSTTDMYSNMPTNFFISSDVILVQGNFLPFSKFLAAFLFVFSHRSLKTAASKKWENISPAVGFPISRGGWTPGVRLGLNPGG